MIRERYRIYFRDKRYLRTPCFVPVEPYDERLVSYRVRFINSGKDNNSEFACWQSVLIIDKKPHLAYAYENQMP